MTLAIVTVYESGIRTTFDADGKETETDIERQLAEYLVRMQRTDTESEIEAMILKRHQNGFYAGDRAEVTETLTALDLLDGYSVNQRIGEWHIA